MLLSYSFSNFHSFVERATLSMKLTQRDTVLGWDRRTTSGERVTIAMAVLGANGAGKSTLVKVGPFLAWFARDSFNLKPDEELAFYPHMAHHLEPAQFEVEAEDIEGARWRYETTLTRKHVVREALYRKLKGGRYNYIFTRDVKSDGSYLVKQQGFGLAESEAAKVRPNVSLISWAKQYGAEMAERVSSFLIATNVTMRGRSLQRSLWDAAAFFNANGPIQEQMRKLLTAWDLGLTDVRIQRIEIPDSQTTTPREWWFPWGIHAANGKRFELPFDTESSGTQTAFTLLSQLLPVLAQGGVAFIDELENDLHPHMIEPILRLFHDASTNPHNAQIIFTCQSPEVLRLLQRAQVTFVEKADCASSAYRGDTIEGLTSEHNLYAKYMAGVLCAIPQI